MQVIINAPLQAHCGGLSRIELSGGDVRGIMDDFARRYPGVRDFVGAVELCRFLSIYINGADYRLSDGLNTVLNPTDQVEIVMAVAGG